MAIIALHKFSCRVDTLIIRTVSPALRPSHVPWFYFTLGITRKQVMSGRPRAQAGTGTRILRGSSSSHGGGIREMMRRRRRQIRKASRPSVHALILLLGRLLVLGGRRRPRSRCRRHPPHRARWPRTPYGTGVPGARRCWHVHFHPPYIARPPRRRLECCNRHPFPSCFSACLYVYMTPFPFPLSTNPHSQPAPCTHSEA